MDHHGLKLAFILIFSLSASAVRAQSPPDRHTRTRQGSLTVTAVVQSSVGVISTADGRQEVFVANAPAAPATVSRLDRLWSDGQDAVSFSFPAGPLQYQVNRETVFANATSQRLVVVTVIPR